MPRRAQSSSLQDRHAILARSQAGESARQIADALGWSVHTVRKWRRLARRRQSLIPPAAPPPPGPLGQFPPALIATMSHLH